MDAIFKLKNSSFKVNIWWSNLLAWLKDARIHKLMKLEKCPIFGKSWNDPVNFLITQNYFSIFKQENRTLFVSYILLFHPNCWLTIFEILFFSSCWCWETDGFWDHIMKRKWLLTFKYLYYCRLQDVDVTLNRNDLFF